MRRCLQWPGHVRWRNKENIIVVTEMWMQEKEQEELDKKNMKDDILNWGISGENVDNRLVQKINNE